MGEFTQQSFIGGMNLLLDDTRIANKSRWSYNQDLSNNQYRLAFDGRNRYDIIDSVPLPIVDTTIPNGIKQEMVTFGEYVIVFVAGKAWYRLYNEFQWSPIDSFSMNAEASRYWTVAVPVSTTNYGRLAVQTLNYSIVAGVVTPTSQTTSALNGILQSQTVAASFGGNAPGLLVQDGINQPQFIYLNNLGYPTARITQNYDQWNAIYGASPSNYGQLLTDAREYVPIGTYMAWTADGILYIAGLDGSSIYRSVSGRPLDFVINVNPDGSKGGDATTTSYSVGVGPISCLRPLSTGGLFVSALNSNFSVTLNRTPNAPTLWGEYQLIRTYLFEATCLSDRCIFDSLGDTKFIDLTGVRSFNAIQQTQNEGRNSVFTATIASAFEGIVQDIAAATLFNNYELYGVNTVFGPAIAVYDTINSSWCAFDTLQTGGKKIKQLAKIEIGVEALFAITEDDQIIQLYASSNDGQPTIRMPAMCSQDPRVELKVGNIRCILTNLTSNYSVTCSLFVNNRFVESQTQKFTYVPPPTGYQGVPVGPDVGSQTNNILFSFPNSTQGWKAFAVLTWSGGGSLVFVSMTTEDIKPMQPSMTQSVIIQTASSSK